MENYKYGKMLVTLIGLGLAFIGYILIAIIPIVGPFYSTLVGTIMGLVGLFLTGHVAAQRVQAKQDTDMHIATVNASGAKVAPLNGNPK